MAKFCPDCGARLKPYNNAPKFCGRCGATLHVSGKCPNCAPSTVARYNLELEAKEVTKPQEEKPVKLEFKAYISDGNKKIKKSYQIVSLHSEAQMAEHNMNLADFVRCSCIPSDGFDSKETAFIDMLYFVEHPDLRKVMIKKEHIICDRTCVGGCTFRVDDLPGLDKRLEDYIKDDRKGSPPESIAYK